MSDLARLTFTKIVGEGNALGYAEGRACFVPGGLPNETAEVRLTRVKPRFAEGYLERIITPSPHRQAAAESHYLACSPWQGVAYDYQLELKQAMVAELMSRPGLELAIEPVVVAPASLHYRNKLEFQLVTSDGVARLAMHERRTFDELTPAPDGCQLGSPAMNAAAIALADALGEFGVAEQVQSLVIRASQQPAGQVAAVIYLRSEAPRKLVAAVPWASLKLAGLSSLAVYRDRSRPEIIWSTGAQSITEHIAGVELSYPLTSFFQTNIPAFEQALAEIMAAVPAGSHVADLYGGVGAIGLVVASKAQRVLGVEIDAAAAEQANANAVAAGIANYTAQAASAERLTPDILHGIDCVIVDPPRAGLADGTIRLLQAAAPARLIYLSCNPVTQARDLLRLTDAYHASSIKPFDFYPGTLHVETLAVLDRR